MSHTSALRKLCTYRDRIRLGLCTNCGKVPARPGYRKCESCATYHRDKVIEAKSRRREQGQCLNCSHKALPDKDHCLKHLYRKRFEQRRRWHRFCDTLMSIIAACLYVRFLSRNEVDKVQQPRNWLEAERRHAKGQSIRQISRDMGIPNTTLNQRLKRRASRGNVAVNYG